MGAIRIALSLAVVLLIAPMAGCSGPRVLRQDSDSARSVGATGAPLGLRETATVGPYEITMIRVRITKDPKSGPMSPDAAPVPPGYELVDVELRIRNSDSGPGSAGAPAPSETAVLLNEDGVAQEGRGVFIDRTGLSPDPSSLEWAAEIPVQPGETLTFRQLFIVDPESEHLALRYEPLRESRGTVVEFSVK